MRVIEVIRRGRRGADGLSNLIGVETITSDRTLTNDDSGKAFRVTATATITIPASVTDGWSVIIDADGATATLSTAATINGGASLSVTDGNAVQVYSTGTAHYARFWVQNALTSLAASGVGFSPITGNSATNVQGAIQNLTTLWNAVTAYGKSLIAAADAAAARTVLGLGSSAVAPLLDEDDMASDSAAGVPSQQSVKAYVGNQISNSVPFTLVATGLLNGTGTPAWVTRTGFSATVTDNAAGDYTVSFDSAQANTNYIVILTVEGPAGVSGRYYAHYDSKTTGGFDININNATGTGTDVDGISVLVLRA